MVKSDNLSTVGIKICHAKNFQVDLSDDRRKFFSSVDSILSRCTYTSDMVKLQLLESHCLPILIYAIDSLNLSKSVIVDLNSWWNSIFRKIFNYNKWESVRDLIFMLGRLDLHHIINLKSLKFLINMSNHSDRSDSLVKQFFHIYKFSSEYAAIFRLFGCKDDWSMMKIRNKIDLSFSKSRYKGDNVIFTTLTGVVASI